jgi:hypothetical protein
VDRLITIVGMAISAVWLIVLAVVTATQRF